jgi:4-carboxymuconolactone decarboxylase
MARLPKLDPAALTPEQKTVYDEIAGGPRGQVRGPLEVWLRRPGLAARAQELGRYCRYDSSLSKQLSELAILVTARAWGAEFEWFAHKKHALDAGLPPEVVEAIRTCQSPVFALDLAGGEQRAVYDVALAMCTQRRLPNALYASALAVLGEGRLVDLIGVLGYYSLISMTINAFEVDLPEGSAPELNS